MLASYYVQLEACSLTLVARSVDLGALGDPVTDQLALLGGHLVMLPSGMIWLATACA